MDTRRSALILVSLRNGVVREVQAFPVEIDPFRGIVQKANEEQAQLIMQRLGGNVSQFALDGE